MILVYVTCSSIKEAQKIGEHLLKLRLCACINIISNMQSTSWWPPKQNQFEKAKEVILLIKTLEEKYLAIETEVHKIHLSKVPCIFAIPVTHADKKYQKWIEEEIK